MLPFRYKMHLLRIFKLTQINQSFIFQLAVEFYDKENGFILLHFVYGVLERFIQPFC